METLSQDEAALKIQRQFWRRKALKRVRILYQKFCSLIQDDSQSTFYYNSKTQTSLWSLPKFMGGRLDYIYENTEKSSSDSDRDEENDSNDSDDSDAESETSEMIRERRRLQRKYPRQ
jgi:hypothetical protein